MNLKTSWFFPVNFLMNIAFWRITTKFETMSTRFNSDTINEIFSNLSTKVRCIHAYA